MKSTLHLFFVSLCIDNLLALMGKKSEIRGNYFIKDEFLVSTEKFSDQFLFEGINVYEVIRVSDGVPLFVDDHCERFSASLRGKGIDFECKKDVIRGKIHKLLLANTLSFGNIKIVYHFEGLGNSYLILYPVEYFYPGKDHYKNGVPCALLQEERPDPALKNWRPEFKDKIRQLREMNNVFEIILYSDDGIITEGSQSNLFFLSKGNIITARGERVLAGITRKYVFEISKRIGVDLIERDFGVEDIKGFESAFLSGTSPKILPVRSIDEIMFNPHHSLVNRIMTEYDKIIQEHISEYRIKYPYK